MRAHTTSTPACAPLVTHAFAPARTNPSAVIVAVVCMPPGSLPAAGSESANDPATYSPEASFGTCFARCASVPKRQMISATMLVTAMVTAVDAQPRAISIIASA